MKTIVNLYLFFFRDYGKEDQRLYWERREAQRKVKLIRRRYGMW